MNKYIIKYSTGCGGEFIASMFEACRQNISPEKIQPNSNNRYDGTKLGTKHQHFSKFLIRTGTLDGKPRYSELIEDLNGVNTITLHGWTFNIIAHLRKNRFRNALIITDSTNYSAYMSVHKIYNPILHEKEQMPKKEAVEEGLYNFRRTKERLSKVSDNSHVTDYARKSFSCTEIDVHEMLNAPFEEISNLAKKVADVNITDQWYARLQEYRETNYKIWDSYK